MIRAAVQENTSLHRTGTLLPVPQMRPAHVPQRRAVTWLVRYGTFLLLLLLLSPLLVTITCTTAGVDLFHLRGTWVASADGGGSPANPPHEAPDDAPCANSTFTCSPTLRFASVEFDGSGASYHSYAAVSSSAGGSGTIFGPDAPTVIQLSGLLFCNTSGEVAEVRFVLKDGSGAVLRYGTETSGAPYTVFGVDPATHQFRSRVLRAGSYRLSVDIFHSGRCVLWSGIIPFTVSNRDSDGPGWTNIRFE